MNRRLIYVLGPSGAGKDSVLSWLRQQMPPTALMHLAQRTIDRPKSDSPDSENHVYASDVDFERLVIEAEFAMHWQANGHRYGVRQAELAFLKDPKYCVFVNGSRAHLPMAAKQYPGLTVLHITADAAVLRERLHRRARETEAGIEARLSRHVTLTVPNGCRLIEIQNNTTLDKAGFQLLEGLKAFKLWSHAPLSQASPLS